MADLLELAARVEAAAGADRELDARIWCALRGVKYVAHFEAYGAQGLTQVEFREPPRRARLISQGRNPWPHAQAYTTSIDAAMTLVPEGYAFGAGRDFLVPGPEGWAWVSHDEDFNIVRAATPALALTAACLRARAAMGVEG